MRKFLLCALLILLFSRQASAELSVIDSYGTLTANAEALQTVSADAPPVVSIFIESPYDLPLLSTDCAIISKVVGSEPLTYQWQRSENIVGNDGSDIFEWIDIIGANAADYFFFVKDNSGGYYRLLVSNSYGSVISDVVKLTVYYPPTLVDRGGNRGGCNSVSGVFGIITLLPALLIFCRKKN